jgi:MarR family transcriptional regulator, temperature-dependent positive regulator of motility
MTSKIRRTARNGFDISKVPSHLLRRCIQHANDLFSREIAASNLTKQQFIVLAAVEQNEGISQADLVAITSIDRSTLSEMISRMMEKNFLDTEHAASDRRSKALRLAADGRRALRNARSASERVEQLLLSSLSANDRARFLKMLGSIAANAN